MAFTSHLDRIDAEQCADTASESIDGVAVTDVYGSRDPECVRLRPSADGSEPKPGDACLVEQAAECGVHIAGLEFEKKHRMDLIFVSILYWQKSGLLFF
ncbi:hypothetical protein JQ615_21425 [Bradyrhizobium jicamae]|uniref:Uncharacterized protein n=1 Tax=Bradyrhizobium jicamae TaxID=280332 RepID=A0ABS5FMG0_9BRAD|nr:hypothetical protein [Bradyrhizobium jicamae]MBR0797954.1 hypothetical protein [Bradyrhizobium jicamae]MBR0931968.1 hypothetical protein [Bradyrhizobium jicamae]